MDLFPNDTYSGRPCSPTEAYPAAADDKKTPKQSPIRSGRVWRSTKLVFGAPIAAFPLDQITRNGRLIGKLVSDLRSEPRLARADLLQRDGRLDLGATALAHVLSEAELRELLLVRRRQTARLGYLAFGLGWVFVGAWLLRVLGLDWTGQRILAAAQFAPFCLIFFLIAFKQAHVNWQLRTGVLGSAGDYLRSAEPFWPRG